MKFSMFVNQDAMQFNLTPENEHEKEFLQLLNKYNGGVSIHAGVDINMTRGNYLRSFGETGRTVAITISQPELKAGE